MAFASSVWPTPWGRGQCPGCGQHYLEVVDVLVNAVPSGHLLRYECQYSLRCHYCAVEVLVTGDRQSNPFEIIERGQQSRLAPGENVTLQRSSPSAYGPGGYIGSGSAYGSYVSSYSPQQMAQIYGVGSSSLYAIDPAKPEPEPTEPGPELRAFDGSFIGYRAWNISNWALCGTGAGKSSPWKPGENKATCIQIRGWSSGTHRAPHPDCHCGFNALARFKDDAAWWDKSNGAFEVVGAIEAWAEEREDNWDGFFLHSTGFRSEFARVVLLATSKEYPRAKNAAIRALAGEHGADVCDRSHLEDAAKEHGQLVPDELLQWAAEGEELSGLERLSQANAWISAQSVAFSRAMQTLQQQSAASSTSIKKIGAALAQAAEPEAEPMEHTGMGPPQSGKYHVGDRVRDRSGQVWSCVKRGKPGQWMKAKA